MSLPFAEEFVLPADKSTYLLGNSLGLQPRATEALVMEELRRWAQLGVTGYFQGATAWLSLDQQLKTELGKLVGAQEAEIAVTSTLTGNIHLLLSRFYRPNGEDRSRRKILVETKPFSSDWYALESHIRAHGLDPSECLMEMQPRPGEHTLRDEDICEMIRTLGADDSLAMVFFGAVNYFTGQLFDIAAITQAAHQVNALVIFDCAHAVGIVPLNLAENGVDAAVWCSYKWLNGGPGAIGGLFVNRRHFASAPAGQLLGWWGHEERTRFKMELRSFEAATGADAFRLSNGCVLSLVCLLASLRVFARTSIDQVRRVSLQLTSRLLLELDTNPVLRAKLRVLTPEEDARRGGHVSVQFLSGGDEAAQSLVRALDERGFVVDWRSPGVVRVAPSPLYTSAAEVDAFCRVLEQILK